MESHARLTDWVVQNGGYLHPHVKIVHTSEKGYHTVVRPGQVIEALTRVASCPNSVMISVLNVMDITPFHCHGTKFPRAFLTQNSATIVQNFFLMEQYLLAAESWWHPYIATLPSPVDVIGLQFMDDSDLAILEGTNLSFAYSKQRQQWQEMYAQGLDHLQTLEWPNAGSYSFELFQWAAVIFGSRSFTSQVLSATLPADRASPIADYNGLNQLLTELFSDGFPVLLPLVDISNHKPSARVEWQARFSFVALQVLERIDTGQELFNNYGPRDNETLLLAYHFVIADNPFDHFTVALKIPPHSPLTTTRTWDTTRPAGSTYSLYVFGYSHPKVTKASCFETALFSFDLLDSISVLAANDREMHTMSLRRQTIMSKALRTDPILDDHRNLLAVISQLLQDCTVRAATLRSTQTDQQPTSQKQSYAWIYRNSQRRILETAVCACKLILQRAISEKSTGDILGTFQASQYMAPSIRDDVEALTGRHVFLSRNESLFSYRHLVSLLKKEAQASCQGCVDEVIRGLDELQEQKMDREFHLNSAKVCVALLLSALATEYARGEPLPQRLKSWMQQLTAWYPTSDPNWTHVPHETPKAAEDSPPPMLMTLLKATRRILASRPKPTTEPRTHTWQQRRPSAPATDKWLKDEMLCWGWNVMEEEGVVVPLHLVDENRPFDWNDSSNSFVMYVPHL